MREHFNYTRSDITALDHTPNAPDFYIADRRHPQRAATPEEVKEWHRLVRKDGTIEIPVATSKAKELREFRQMNAAATERAVQLATSNITDPAARQAARSDLLKLLSDNGHERVSAAARLSELARLNKPEAASILKATWAMTEHPSYAKNPSLRLTLARIEMDQIRGKSGPGLDLRAKELAGEALKLAGGYDPVSNQRRHDLSVDKSEAALINRYAAQIFREAGDEPQAAWSDRLARFYEVGDTERATAFEDKLIESTPGTHMRATTPYEQQIHRRIMVIQEQKEQLLNVKSRELVDYNLHDAPAAAPQNTLYGEEYRTKLRRGENIPRQQQRETFKFNQNGVERGASLVASVDLVNKVGQYALMWRNTREIPKLDGELQQLERQLTAHNYYRVPPRPENLPKLEAELRRVFVPKEGQPTEAAIRVVMRRMEEASDAFWSK